MSPGLVAALEQYLRGLKDRLDENENDETFTENVYLDLKSILSRYVTTRTITPTGEQHE